MLLCGVCGKHGSRRVGESLRASTGFAHKHGHVECRTCKQSQAAFAPSEADGLVPLGCQAEETAY